MGVRVLGLVLELGFWGWGFWLIGLGACGVEPSGFFRVGAFYVNIEELLWEKKLCSLKTFR